MIGTIAKLKRDGYGLIEPDQARGTHLLFNQADVQGVSFDRDLHVGQRVTFTRGIDPRSRRQQAFNVRPIDGFAPKDYNRQLNG